MSTHLEAGNLVRCPHLQMGAHQEHPQKGLKPVSVLREDSAVFENQKHLVLWDAGVEPSY